MSNISVDNLVQIVDVQGNATYGKYLNQKGKVTDNSGDPNKGPFTVLLESGESVTIPKLYLLESSMETYDSKMFDLISSYTRSLSGDVYYLLKSKSVNNLYIQIQNPKNLTSRGPYFVGVTKNDVGNPNNNTDIEFDLSNTTFSFEDAEKNNRFDKAMIVIIGQSNTDSRNTYRYICTRIGGPWKRQQILRV